MLKLPLVVGAKGGMGRRYTSILDHLGYRHLGMDVGDQVPYGFDAVILATPTNTHVDLLKRFSTFGVPMLCEKPISTDLTQVLSLCDWADSNNVLLTMVNQYRHISPDLNGKGFTSYNYFRTGQDGLYWDTISITALANSFVQIRNTSPFWQCTINGFPLSIASMDSAYVSMIGSFMITPPTTPGTAYIRSAHTKVQRLIEASSDQDFDRDSGPKWFNPTTGESL